MDAGRDYRPRGYCPQCDYPVDMGTCPECGATLAVGELRRSPRSLLRRHRRHLLGALAAFVFLAGGYALLRSNVWYRLLPTSLLLSHQGADDHPATVELFRRYVGGNLNAADAAQMLGQAVNKCTLDIPSATAAGTEVAIEATAYFQVPKHPRADREYQYLLRDFEIRCDGEVVGSSANADDMRRALKQRFRSGCHLSCSIPPPLSGEHEIEVRLTVWLNDVSLSVGKAVDGSALRGGHRVHTWNVAAARRLVVEDRREQRD